MADLEKPKTEPEKVIKTLEDLEGPKKVEEPVKEVKDTVDYEQKYKELLEINNNLSKKYDNALVENGKLFNRLTSAQEPKINDDPLETLYKQN